MATHQLEPTRANLHGHFSRDLAPALTIEPGDTVRCRTLNAGWWWEDFTAGEHVQRPVERDPELDRGHALCGPIAIRGAEPGMALEVQIGRIRPASWGITAANVRDPRYEKLGITRPTTMPWRIDADAGTATNRYGHTVRLRPFMGVMGLAPAEPGAHPTAPPRNCGGNMDLRELTAGSVLWLPIEVASALFSVGDGHAAQGDGEVSGTAIECPMEEVELTFALRPDLKLRTPRADTAAGLITMGFSRDLNEATQTALHEMLDLLQARYHLDREAAISLASVVVDLRITQIVNGVEGVHAVLPHDAVISST